MTMPKPARSRMFVNESSAWTRLLGLALAGLLPLGCGDDSMVTPDDDGGTDGSTTDSTTNSTVNPTIDPTIQPSTSDDATDTIEPDGSGTDTSTTDVPPMCGNDAIDGDELCDGTDLGGADCMTEGFDDGVLGCADDCMSLDTSGCVMFSCGNDTLEGKEVCDGADLGGQDCASQGFDMGTLACAADCTGFDTSGCENFVCGDNMAQGMEVCDGVALLGEDCMTQGFDGGTLACAGDCMSFDTAGCIMFMCGNDMIEGMEACDGSDLNGFDCSSMGFDAGTLGCLGDCSAFDTSGCQLFNCGNDTIEGLEVCDGVDLAGETCVSQGFDGGALACAGDCAGYDTSGCTLLSCGNGVIDPMEACDGMDLGGETCITQGYPGGVLACLPNCQGLDTSGCSFGCEEEVIGMAVGPAVAMGSTVAEDDDFDSTCGGGPDRIILFTAPADGDYVMDTLGSDYDTAMGLFSDCNAFSELTCNDDFGVGVESQVNLTMTAGDPVLILVEGFGGDTGNFVLNIDQITCEVEENVGGMLGAPVTMGTTVGEDENLSQSCADGGAVDYVVLFTAPASATFIFDTFGSGYDTALSAYSACNSASEIACNDDAGMVLQSELMIPLLIGEQVYVAVSGFSGETGDFVLNIAQM